MGRSVDRAERGEEERERMSPAERRFTRESVEGHQAEEFLGEHLGGHENRFDEDDPRRY
jgi:hypothetical protein